VRFADRRDIFLRSGLGTPERSSDPCESHDDVLLCGDAAEKSFRGSATALPKNRGWHGCETT